MNQPNHQAAPTADELESLLRLLDDETPEVRDGVAARLARCDGDLSEWLAGRRPPLAAKERALLSQLLGQPRREAMRRDWQVPSGGAAGLNDDWDAVEAMLRLVSDFLHDGVSLRQPLSDALDLLAEEAAAAGVESSEDLRMFLFKRERLRGNHEDGGEPHNFDLAWVLANGRSNPTGLGLVFILVARRMGYDVEAVDFPGHFLCRIFREGYPVIIDCHEHGCPHLQSTLLESPDLTRASRALLRQSAPPGTVMLRFFEELHFDLIATGRREDAELVERLLATLAPP